MCGLLNFYINMKWKPTLSFYTTNLSKLGQWDKPGSHWRHVYEWMWTGIYHTKVRPKIMTQNARTTKYINMTSHENNAFLLSQELGFFFWSTNISPGPIGDMFTWMWTGIYHTKVRQLICAKCATTTVAIANYSQRQRHDGALTDVFSIFFLSQNGKQPQKIDVPLVLRRCKSR